jgi:hypothetical protein
MTDGIKNPCQCNQAACGCEAAPAAGCSCEESCTCSRECRCDEGCACAAKP